VLALFELRFRDQAFVEPQAVGHPVYLLLAMTPENIVRLKPQNLVMGLPVSRRVHAA
jgi:hypothetical protein